VGFPFLAALLLTLTVLACREAPDPPGPALRLDMTPADSARLDVRPVDSVALADFRREYAKASGSALPVFTKYLPVLGAATLLDFLEGTSSGCHHESHELGRALYAVSGDLGTALRRCDTRCTSGCMHGAVTAAFGDATVESVTNRMNAFCGEGDMASLHKPGNCAHGLGHALMFVTNGDVSRSIDGCLGFSREAMQYYCGTGVFMDRFMRDSAAWKGATSRAPCDEERLFPGACYRYKGIEMVKAMGHDSAKSVCAGLQGLQRHGCFHGIGYAAVVEVFEDPEKLPERCGATEWSDRVACVEGAIEKLADFHQGRARAACSFLEADLRPACDEAVERKMYGLDKSTFSLYYDPDAIARRQAAIRSGLGPRTHVR
jgi:hypothetical protein